MNEYITSCPRNCYSTCTFRVYVNEGKVVRILPFEGNRATPEGPCVKGLSYLERDFSGERIIHPLKKNSDGSFTTITKEEALGILAGRLADVRDNYGSHAVLFYKGSGIAGMSNDIAGYFWKKFGGVTTLYGNLCWPAGLEAVRLTMGEIKHNAPWDIENAGLIIIWGKNPAETNIQEIIHIDRALKKGARLIVIDPRRTPTSDKADIIVRPTPGTDAALALAIANTIVIENLVDNDFVSKYVKGYEEFRKSLTITAEDAESITGVPAEAIQKIAHMIGTTKNVTISAGYGLQRYSNGGQTIRAILSIIAITGKTGRSGCGFNYANLQSYIFDSLKEPLSYYPDKQADAPFRRCVSMPRFAECVDSIKDPAIKFAWFERGNPVTQLPDSDNVIRVIENIEFKVVIEQFMTDTARLADIVLPAKGVFEQPDVIGSYWHPYIQYRPAFIPYPGDVMPESEIYFHLLRLLDIPDEEGYFPSPGNENFDKWLSLRINSHGKVNFDDLKNGPLLAPGYEEIAYESMIFETPSGKIELFSDTAAELWGVSELPGYVKSGTTQHERNELRLLTPCIGSRIHSQFGNLDSIKAIVSAPSFEISNADASNLGLCEGDYVIISNDYGSLRGNIHISGRVSEGMIVFPNGIWKNEGGGVNALISPKETDMGYGAAFHDNFVRIERIDK